MKKLGLIGGMGPESTMPYYHDIVYGVKEKLGRDEFPALTMESVNVYKLLKYCSDENYEALTAYLLEALSHLKAAGADFAALSANTPHIVFDRLEKASPLPLVSIVEATADEAKRRGYRKIGVLGTIFTMTGEFFRKPFTARDIALVTPSEQEMEIVFERIVNELEQGIVKEETLKLFQKIILRMKDEEGIEAIILGCTELPLLLNDDVTPVPCLDTVEIHVKALVEEIVGK